MRLNSKFVLTCFCPLLPLITILIQWKFVQFVLTHDGIHPLWGWPVQSHVLVITSLIVLFFLHEVTYHLLFQLGQMHFNPRYGLVATEDDTYVFRTKIFSNFLSFQERLQWFFINFEVLLLNSHIVKTQHFNIPVWSRLLWVIFCIVVLFL